MNQNEEFAHDYARAGGLPPFSTWCPKSLLARKWRRTRARGAGRTTAIGEAGRADSSAPVPPYRQSLLQRRPCRIRRWRWQRFQAVHGGLTPLNRQLSVATGRLVIGRPALVRAELLPVRPDRLGLEGSAAPTAALGRRRWEGAGLHGWASPRYATSRPAKMNHRTIKKVFGAKIGRASCRERV